MKLLEVLPTTLYEFEAPDEIHNLIYTYTETLDWPSTSNRDNDPSWGKTREPHLHTNSNVQEYTKWVTEQVNKVKEVENLCCSTMLPVNMWVNLSTLGQWHHRHTHKWSFLSTIYYVSGEEGPTWFSRLTDYHNQPMQLKRDEERDIIYKHFPKPKTLLVFPSTLEHSVSENISEVPRITVSANFLPGGKVGTGMGYDTDKNLFPWEK
jgi:uncharacterized protein (TIGR02466 family)